MAVDGGFDPVEYNAVLEWRKGRNVTLQDIEADENLRQGVLWYVTENTFSMEFGELDKVMTRAEENVPSGDTFAREQFVSQCWNGLDNFAGEVTWFVNLDDFHANLWDAPPNHFIVHAFVKALCNWLGSL